MAGQTALQSKIQQEIAELSTALSKAVESFRQVQNPLQESREKVPQATDQLDKISEQTEAAAHQMLDRIEQITQREEDIISGLDTIRSQAPADTAVDLGTLIESLTEKANTNLNDAFMIMDALQFQDITAQQMNHAAALLEDIESKLKHILLAITGRPADNAPGSDEERKQRDRVYDPHADFSDKQTQQEDIDSIFAKGKTD